MRKIVARAIVRKMTNNDQTSVILTHISRQGTVQANLSNDPTKSRVIRVSSIKSKHQRDVQVDEEMSRKKMRAKDITKTEGAMQEILDSCYQLYDYLKKCERCSYFAEDEMKNGKKNIIFYVTNEL